jgi:hypothetical protein
MRIVIYCSGGIQKGRSAKKVLWSEVERNELAESARPLDCLFFTPDDEVPLEDSEALFGRDMYQLSRANFVVVDARERRGIGIGIEVLAAKMLKIPLVVVAPPNSHYRHDHLAFRGGSVSNYLHPHLSVLADCVADDFAGAGAWIRMATADGYDPKDQGVVMQAVTTYKRRLLPHDPRMIQMLEVLGASDGVEDDLRWMARTASSRWQERRRAAGDR